MSKRAAIYNRYLKTAGGGERSSLQFACALEDLGYQISLLTEPGSNVSLQDLAPVFGIKPNTNWELLELEEWEVNDYCKSSAQQVFVNHTFSSFIPAPTPCALYALMFPHQINQVQLYALGTYQWIFCNSPFSQLYAQQRWREDLPLIVAPPPISREHFRYAKEETDKEKLILNVGRFNIDGHSKCQKEAIEAFLKLRSDKILGPDWRMLVVGQLNEGEANLEYFRECSALAPDLVEVRKNVSFAELAQAYQRAAVLWQFTGFGLDYGQIPERCEHLGLVALDALCYGTVPICYDRSGATMLTAFADVGYSFHDIDQLSQCMRWVEADFGGALQQGQMRRCRAEARKYSYAHFRAQLQSCLGI